MLLAFNAPHLVLEAPRLPPEAEGLPLQRIRLVHQQLYALPPLQHLCANRGKYMHFVLLTARRMFTVQWMCQPTGFLEQSTSCSCSETGG
jgi:hypothetical protein